MNDTYKVSVIVTVHNSEKYLERCLQSVCNQTLRDIEILCIDGQSFDKSPEILSKFREEDNRVKIINDRNASYGHKINVGIENAMGRYIAILESDDQYDPLMLVKLFDLAEKYQLDYADSDFYEFWEDEKKIFKYKKNKYNNPAIYNRVVFSDDNNELNISTGAIWTGLYRKSFLKEQNIKLNESNGASFQDTSFGFQVGVFSNRNYHLSECLYYYRIDNDGSSVKDNKKIFEISYELAYLKSCLKKRNVSEQKVWESYYEKKYSTYFWNASRLTGNAREEFLELYLSELQSDVQKGFLKKGKIGVYRDTYLALEDYQEFKKILKKSKSSRGMGTICSMINEIGGRDIVIFGGGAWGKQVIDLYVNREEQIKCICDNSEELYKKKVCGYDVLSVLEAVKKYPTAVYIIASLRNGNEMKKQIMRYGILEENIFFYK